VKTVDRILQRWRISKARPFLSEGQRVLDIGSSDGALFQTLQFLGAGCVGIDPGLPGNVHEARYSLLAGEFPRDMPEGEQFDAITMLAVLEHFPSHEYGTLSAGCRRFLKPGGKLIITVPSPRVDDVLRVLIALRLAHGMSLEEHHGYDVHQTDAIFRLPEFRLLHYKPFQLNLNHLFVFERAQ
jgi:2-polyprenyl-3-methyl-5-hydroxy-6-metoxy-1,4-benzoquinol methylase